MAQKLWFKKKSPLHGSGLFAKNDIKKGSKVIQYIGDKVTKKEGDKRAEIRLSRELENGRSRINCTAKDSKGNWRWFGHQFYN